MQDFFCKTELSQLTFDADDSRFIKMEAMGWTREKIDAVYWRACYSYILCTTIAFFEDGVTSNKKRSMALTGAQGTGKTVLGSIIALVMAKACDWHVKYTWNGSSCSLGDEKSGKIIHIVDFSVGSAFAPDDDNILFVSSANESRWHDFAQQETWSEPAGNFCFMDTVSHLEMKAIAARKGRKDADTDHNFSLAGGVIRICIEPRVTVERLIAGAVANLEPRDVLSKLLKLEDQVDWQGPGRKLYPGLIGHIGPTDPSRNQFNVTVSSPVVRRKLVLKLREKSEGALEKLMKELLKIPKARGFGGLIWEPFFTAKIQQKMGDIIIVGKQLPARDKSSALLLKRDLRDIGSCDFKALDDFVSSIEEWAKSKEQGIVLAKAIHDNFIAVDAILVVMTKDTATVVGLQMTVAQSRHDLKEKGVMDLADAAETLQTRLRRTISTQVWFLQPEACLQSNFSFTSIQALTFDEARPPQPQGSEALHCGKRRRKAPERFGEVSDDQGTPRRQSNDPQYWTKAARKVSQYIAVVRFVDTDSATSTVNAEADSLLTALNAATETKGATFPCEDPYRRPWKSTTRVLGELIDSKKLQDDFVDVLGQDIEDDEKKLEAMGANFTKRQDSAGAQATFMEE
jgi:hypothetical protein